MTKLFLDGTESTSPAILPHTLEAVDERYNYHYTVDALYYDAKDFLIINKPYAILLVHWAATKMARLF